MSCGVRCRHDSDPELLWLWRRLAATAPIQPLAWELPSLCHRCGPKKEKKSYMSHVLLNKKKKEKAYMDSSSPMPYLLSLAATELLVFPLSAS